MPCLTRGPPETRCPYLQQTLPCGAEPARDSKSNIQWKAWFRKPLPQSYSCDHFEWTINNNLDGKASVVLLEYIRGFFKQGLAGWLPSCSLEGGRNSFNLVTFYWPWLTTTCFLSEFHQHRRYYRWLRFLSAHTGPRGICLQFYLRNFQVFTNQIAISELLYTLTSFKGYQQPQK